MGFIFSILISQICHSQDLQKYNPDRELIEGVVIPNTELSKIHSEIIGEDFLIYVQLPMSYKENPEKKYPVWYNTDANRGFPFVANTATFLTFPPADIPEMIVIGIGYLTKGLEDWAILRTRDLTPTNNPETDEYWTRMISEMSGRKDINVRSGGAPLFLDFVANELIPYVESEYRVDTENRTLGGYSYGGLFTLYTLFKSPGLFHKYFAGSPSLHYDNEILFSYENEYAELHQDMNAEVFITAGGLEENLVDEVIRIKERLLRRDYPSLDLTVQIFENENHRSCVGAAFFRAMYVLHTDK
jgi:predicted alpha/beta superfamily hydrolase